jgi:hypothetical protein
MASRLTVSVAARHSSPSMLIGVVSPHPNQAAGEPPGLAVVRGVGFAELAESFRSIGRRGRGNPRPSRLPVPEGESQPRQGDERPNKGMKQTKPERNGASVIPGVRRTFGRKSG